MAHKSDVDWDALVEDFKQGMHQPALAEKYGISKSGLKQGLRARGLTRNAESVARSRATRKADEQSVRDAMMPVNLERVEAMAEVGAAVLTRHRRSLHNTQLLLERMEAELREANIAEVEESVIEYFDALSSLSPLQASALRQRMQRALNLISLPGRFDMIETCTRTKKMLHDMERKAFRLDDEGNNENTYEDYLKEMHEKIISRQQLQKQEQRQLALQNESVAS